MLQMQNTQSRYIAPSTIATALCLAVPFLVYAAIVFRYAVNIPFYDDYTQIVDIINRLLLATPAESRMDILFERNAGHIALLTRVFAYLQYLCGGVNLRIMLLVANGAWMLCCLLLLLHLRHNKKIPWAWLLPVPYLMLSLAHWESMDMTLGAWQMYIASTLLPFSCMLALTRNHATLAACLLATALFGSAGNLALYPIAILFLLTQKQWKGLIVFGCITLPALALFLHFNPVDANTQKALPPLLAMITFCLKFMGNIVAAAQYDLSALATTQQFIGGGVILAGVFYSWKARSDHFPKLLLLYIMMLGGMAAYARGVEDSLTVSRYAPFALLAAACVYGYFALYHSQRNHISGKVLATIITFASIGLWASSLYYCPPLLAGNREQRVNYMQNYIATGDTQYLITWDIEWFVQVLDNARKLGVYDYHVAKEL